VTESRKVFVARAEAILTAEGSIEAPNWPGAEVSPGSSSGARGRGDARNLDN
jgi:hypothetical protein